MKLLILGLILIGVLLIQIYYINKSKETFQSEVDKALVAGERKFMQGQDKYWDVRSQGIGAGLVTTKPGINEWVKLDDNKDLKRYTPKIGLEQTSIDRGITNCRALTKCEQLNNTDCGYCAFDKEFRLISPNSSIQKNSVNKAIKLVKMGKVKEANKIIKHAINNLLKKKCKKIILGCTELPIAIFAFKSFKNIKTSKTFLDPNLILANSSMKKYKTR